MNGAAVNPGERLKAARERAGWSLEQVALKLRLSVVQVAALEKGEREGLPPAAYVRGYLRSYAQLLGLDPQEFANARVIAEPAAVAGERPAAANKTKLPWEPLLYTLFVIGLVVGVVWWRMDRRVSTRPVHNTVSSVEAIRALPPRLRSLAMPGANDGQLSEFPLRRRGAGPRPRPTAPVPVQRQPLSAGPVSGVSAASAPLPRPLPILHRAPVGKASAPKVVPTAKGFLAPGVKTRTEAAPSPVSPPSAVPNPGGLISLPQGRHYATLRIRATSGGVRVLVRDTKGTRLLVTRIAAGHSVHVVGLPPFSVVLSRSRGVFMTIGGHAVALPSAHKGRRLRITVDR